MLRKSHPETGTKDVLKGERGMVAYATFIHNFNLFYQKGPMYAKGPTGIFNRLPMTLFY